MQNEFTIVITDTQNQAGFLISELAKLKFKIVSFPTVEFIEPASNSALDDSINNLADYDWIYFSTETAVEFFLNRLFAHDLETFELDAVQVCAENESVAEKLRLAQVHVDVVLSFTEKEINLSPLIDFLGGEPAFSNLSFLAPTAKNVEPSVINRLKIFGAKIELVPVVVEKIPDNADTAKLKAMFFGGAIDCILFNSQTALQNFLRLFQAEKLNYLLNEVKIVFAQNVKKQQWNDFELKPDLVLSSTSDAEFTSREIYKFLIHRTLNF
jgi:uroporphyrinogen-III synthase